jgi:hypothetical protein
MDTTLETLPEDQERIFLTIMKDPSRRSGKNLPDDHERPFPKIRKESS